jgi:UDP-glucose 4-epimerase
MRCLITGVAGFIGSHLADRLLGEGHEVVGVDAFTDAYDPAAKEANVGGMVGKEKFRLIRGDVAEMDLQEALDGVERVFHMAAQAGVRGSWGSHFHLYLWRNVLATQRLLEACKGKELSRFIYASSSSVYGDEAPHPTREDALPRPTSPYGVTKLAAENLCRLYFRNHGVPTVSLRFFTVYGPRQRPDMAFHRFLRALWRNEPLTVYGDGGQSRDFTYVDDIVEASLSAAASGLAGEVYNVGGGTRATLREVLDIMAAVTDRTPRVAWGDDQKGDVRHTWADLGRARRDLGYEPRVSLREGISREWDWVREEQEAGSGRSEGATRARSGA